MLEPMVIFLDLDPPEGKRSRIKFFNAPAPTPDYCEKLGKKEGRRPFSSTLPFVSQQRERELLSIKECLAQ